MPQTQHPSPPLTCI